MNAARLGPLVWRALGVGAWRGALTAASVGASAFLALALLGVERSVTAGITAYATQPGVDVWVLPHGQDNLVRLSGLLSREQVAAAKAVPGAEVVNPVLRTFLVLRRVDAPDEEPGTTALALAMPDAAGPGGPPGWVAGRAPQAPDEIGLDRALAWSLGVGVGDRVRVTDRELRVVGLSRDTDLIATRFVFLDLTVAQQLSSYRGQASFLAVKLRDGEGPEVRAALALAADADVVEPSKFLSGNLRELLGGFRSTQRAVAALGLIASAFVVALLIQGVLEQRRRDVALLLAMGSPMAPIVLALVGEMALLVAVGVWLGGALVALFAWVTARWWPIVVLEPSLADALWTSALFVAVACLAAFVPLQRLRRVDPSEAFRP